MKIKLPNKTEADSPFGTGVNKCLKPWGPSLPHSAKYASFSHNRISLCRKCPKNEWFSLVDWNNAQRQPSGHCGIQPNFCWMCMLRIAAVISRMQCEPLPPQHSYQPKEGSVQEMSAQEICLQSWRKKSLCWTCYDKMEVMENFQKFLLSPPPPTHTKRAPALQHFTVTCCILSAWQLVCIYDQVQCHMIMISPAK